MKIKLSAGLNLTLYSLLLIVTPFLMLMNFLQEAIGSISRANFTLSGFEVPYVVVAAAVLLIALTIFLFKYITWKRLIGLVILTVLFFIGQNSTDYYFNHKFYELQHNWHYFAYGIFTFLAYRKFMELGYPTAKVILRTFLLAFVISLFDELIQVYISNRVFDLSDVGKDMWGVIIGQCGIYFVYFEYGFLQPFRIRHKKLKDYLKNPFTVLFFEMVLAYTLLVIASLLSSAEYWKSVVLISILIFGLIFVLIHLGNNRFLKYTIGFISAALALYFVVAQFTGNARVKRYSDNIIIYKGIPFVYFDLMIYPEGGFRPVDKKSQFLLRDKQKLDDLNPNILLLATGTKGEGGKGFNEQRIFEFKPNLFKSTVYQVIRLKNQDAIMHYNLLISENKKVLFIIHNQ